MDTLARVFMLLREKIAICGVKLHAGKACFFGLLLRT